MFEGWWLQSPNSCVELDLVPSLSAVYGLRSSPLIPVLLTDSESGADLFFPCGGQIVHTLASLGVKCWKSDPLQAFPEVLFLCWKPGSMMFVSDMGQLGEPELKCSP